ncbi:phosphotransferase [Pelagibius sp.]|uniref:phosphotransferase n=1 Tax=Pelagibius sp. TaxID=1931238 RepID=UPI003BAFAC52
MFDVEGEAHLLPGERERNFRLYAAEDSYFLKVAPAGTDKPSLEMQAAALAHLAAIAPELPVPRVIRSGKTAVVMLDDGLLVFMTSWLPGVLMLETKKTPGLQREVAALAAYVGKGLRGFFHPSAGRRLIWDLSRAGELQSLLAHTTHQDRAKLAGAALGSVLN